MLSSTLVFGISENDSTVVVEANIELLPKSFDQRIIDNFKQDSAFLYELPPETRPNFLQMMFRKFFEWLVFIFGNEGVAWLVLIIMIILGAVGIGFAFYGLFGIGKTIPVYSKEEGGIDYLLKEENIHEMNFSEEINLAVEQKDFRRAIRLVYLYALKILSDQKIINWIPSKTNHDYLLEIQIESFKDLFSTMSYYFEYVWYGDFQASEIQYREMQKTLSSLQNKLQQDV